MAKGQKTGGREKGTPNKLTREMRTAIKDVLADEIEKIPELLNSLDDRSRLEMIIRLLPFVLPRVESVSMNQGEPFDPFDELD